MDGTDGFPTSLEPLAGGHSGETFLSDIAGEQAVVRVYGLRSAHRGALAPEIDAAVLELVRGLLPVPVVLEVRRGDPDVDLPGLLVTSLLPGERLDVLLPTLSPEGLRTVGQRLGVLAGRLGHMVQPRRGTFVDRSLHLEDAPFAATDLPTWLEQHAGSLPPDVVEGLRPALEEAQDLLDVDRRACLVHADLVPSNLLVDPTTLELTGVLDWERAHSGRPLTDLGSLLRQPRDPVLVEAVLEGYRGLMSGVPDGVLDRARAADLFALVELAAGGGSSEVVVGARDQLQRIARTGNPGTDG